MSDSYLEAPAVEEDLHLSSAPVEGGAPSHEDGEGDKKRRLSPSEDEAPGSRRPRVLQSAIAAVVRLQSDNGPHGEQSYVSRTSVQEAQAKPDAVSRNKRMLSSLLGHLGQAKRSLERDSSVIERQALRAAAAIERNRADSDRVSKLNADKAREELNLRNAAIVSQRKGDISTASALWARQLRASQSCYFTETSPRLAWLPGLVDEDFTALFDADKRRREVDAMIRSREEDDARRIADMESELEAISSSSSVRLPSGTASASAAVGEEEGGARVSEAPRSDGERGEKSNVDVESEGEGQAEGGDAAESESNPEASGGTASGEGSGRDATDADGNEA